MGRYIQNGQPPFETKYKTLIAMGGELQAVRPLSIASIPEDKALVVLVDNGPWDAAAYIFNQDEYDAWLDPESGIGPRQHWWFIIPKHLAEEFAL